MSFRILFFTTFIALTFAACQTTPDVPLTAKFQKYAQTEVLCKSYQKNPNVEVPSAIKDACNDFSKRLTKANQFEYDLEHFNDKMAQTLKSLALLIFNSKKRPTTNITDSNKLTYFLQNVSMRSPYIILQVINSSMLNLHLPIMRQNSQKNIISTTRPSLHFMTLSLILLPTQRTSL